MSDTDEFMQAQMYDRMINWKGRLNREIPVISQYFDDLEPIHGDRPIILDVACSSGRHSFELNREGLETVGFDISPHFIQLAEEIQQEIEADTAELRGMSRFVEADGAEDKLIDAIQGILEDRGQELTYVDGAILLGNAIANMGNYSKGKALLQHIFILLRPGGKFFVQTVNKPEKPWYNPLREKDGIIIQRIMVPEPIPENNEEGQEHNVVLHVNQIDAEKVEYKKQKADNLFFMYRMDEFQSLVESVGFEVEAVFSGYEGNEVEDVDGETLIWKLSKPEIPLLDEGLQLFQRYTGIDAEEIKYRTMKLWQASIRENWYHCVRGYRFLYPRIVSHPDYEKIMEEKSDSAILDLACHTGTDLRQMWVDGARKLYGVDISNVFIDLGYQLFDDKDQRMIEFTIVDALDNKFLNIDLVTDQYETSNLEQMEIDYSAITGDFSRYIQYFGLIHAGSLLHLLQETDIIALIKRVYLLLEDGGIFFGRTVGMQTPGLGRGGLGYLHSIDSLQSVFNAVGFSEIDVVVMPRNTGYGEATTSTVLQLGFKVRK